MFKNNWRSFLAWEKSTQDTIDFKKCYVDMISEKGDLMAGLLLSQIVYWYLPNKEGKSKLKIKKEGHFWLAKEAKEWYDEIRFSEANYKTAMKKLVEEKIIIKKIFKFNNKTTTHIRLNIPVFLDKLNNVLSKYENDIHDENTEFEQYLNDEINAKMADEPYSSMGLVESTNLESANQPFSNGRINQSRKVESTIPITKNTKKNNTKNTLKDLNQDLNQINEELFSMRLPFSIKKYFSKKVMVLVNDSFDIFEVEEFYNSNPSLIVPNCEPTDFDCLNDLEFSRVVKKAFENAKRPITKSTYGLIKSWVLNAISYKRERTLDSYLDDTEEMIEDIDFFDNPVADRILNSKKF